MNELLKTGLEDIANCFEIDKNLYETYVVGEIYKNKSLMELIEKRQNITNWKVTTPLGGPGTVLNGMVLYSLIRHYDMCDVLETGVAGGLYTGFLLAGLETNNWEDNGVLTSLEISDDMEKVACLLPDGLRNAKVDWYLKTGRSSLEYFVDLRQRNLKHAADLYSHDSLHTMSHMLKELIEFKKSASDKFIVFIDDEKSEDFWNKSLSGGFFNKSGYDVRYISGQESRLNGHLGGFVQFIKRGI